jgi:peptidyl-prolyl cis-trans isomerase SurA
MKKKILIVLFTFISFQANTIETKIIYNIQNEIITNIDIKNEFKYLLALNNSLKELDKDRILNISNESIIREKIKKIEISKNFKEIKINQDYSDLLIKNIYSKLNLKSISEFETYLKSYDLKISDIIAKITIDALWNELIINKYASQVEIDREKIQKEINNIKYKNIKQYQLSEIIYEIKNKNEINEIYNEIIKNINNSGFKNTASIYSISDSAKFGGDIGWINEGSLNSIIKKKILNLKVGEISEPITLANGILVLKIMNIKDTKIDIDHTSQLENAINYERNRQLSQYSKIYYNKIKKNMFNE